MNLLLFILGTCLGSFLGAYTYRFPRHGTVLKGRSICDNCGKNLPWYTNIPIASYIFLKGRSSCCNKKVSIRYPIIEFVAGVFCVLTYLLSPSLYYFSIYFLLFLVSFSILIIDIENQIIPDELALVVFLLSFLIPIPGVGIFERLLTGFALSSFLLFLHLITRGRGMGLGDVKLAISIGSWLSLYHGLLFLFGAFLTGGIVASILLIAKEAKLKTKIAFGPFMIVSFWFILFFLK